MEAEASNGDSTGKQTKIVGPHTVGEVGGSLSGTNLGGYVSTIVCRDGGGTGATVASGSGTDLNVLVHENDDIVCTIFNNGATALSVNKTGTGDGTVTSAPLGIDCGSACESLFTAGSAVILTAVPDRNSRILKRQAASEVCAQ